MHSPDRSNPATAESRRGAANQPTPGKPVNRSGLAAVLALCLWAGLLALPATAAQTPDDPWLVAIEEARAVKDSLFRVDETSPIPIDQRDTFDGLSYYPPDRRYRVEGALHRYARLRQVKIADTQGTTMFVERIGRFHFQWDGKSFWLEVMGSTRDNDLTVYFTDGTNGLTTYPAGRYAPILAQEDGSYILDFNRAYSPYCAYDANYICPLPPSQNRLSFRVEAGEVLAGPDLAH